MDLDSLKQIVETVAITKPGDKIYLSDPKPMAAIWGLGAEVLSNYQQQGGSWYTELKVGFMTFCYVSPKKLF
jgi:hypothetical protein